MNIVKITVGVALGLVVGIVLLSALPGMAYYVAYAAGHLWFSGMLPVLLLVAALIIFLLWRDKQQAKMRALKRGGGSGSASDAMSDSNNTSHR